LDPIVAKMASAAPACLHGESLHCRFGNDDGCGDWIVGYGSGSEMQLFNTLSAVSFLLAGLRLCSARHPMGVRHFGVMLSLTAVGSASLHATSANTGFFMDIVPMAIIGAMLLHAAIHVLQLHTNQCGQQAEMLRFVASAVSAAVAVWVPWALIEAGYAAETTWAVWAVLFGSFGTIFGVVALVIFSLEEYSDSQGTVFQDVGQATAFILTGLLCTVHSFIPGLCTGWFAKFPLHSLWHVFSAVSSFKTGRVLDAVLTLSEALDHRQAVDTQSSKAAQRLARPGKQAGPLLRRTLLR